MCKSYICVYIYIYMCDYIASHTCTEIPTYTEYMCIYIYIHIHIYNMRVYIHVIIYIYIYMVFMYNVYIFIYGVHLHMWPHVYTYIYIYIYIYVHVFLLVLFSVPCAKVPRAPSAWCASRSWRSGRAQFSLAISRTENGFNQPLIPWKLIVNGSLPFIPLFIASTIPWMASTLVDMN